MTIENTAASIHAEHMGAVTIDSSVWDRIRLTESDRALLWRAEVLEQGGYDDEAVARLALSRDVDLHRAVDLLARGCSQDLALQILL